jgi:site-specific recombinase XerD
MTALRQKLIDEIELRGLAANTKESYVRSVALLARYHHRSPDLLSDEEIKNYLLYLLREKKLAPKSLIVTVSGLRFFYRFVLQRSTIEIEQALPRLKGPVRRPEVYSVEELQKLFTCPSLNRKHRAMFMTAYGAGLRAFELGNLTIAHLRSDRMQIRVDGGKGNKDRYTLLSPRLLEEPIGGSGALLIGSFPARPTANNQSRAKAPVTHSMFGWSEPVFRIEVDCILFATVSQLISWKPDWTF